MGGTHSFSLFEVAVLIGITQGAIISGLIGLYKRQHLNKRLLMSVLLVFNLLCIKILIHTTGLWQTAYLRYFPLGFELLIQPIIWFYINSLVNPEFRLTRGHWLHLLPFALSISYALSVYVATLSTTNLNQKDAIASSLAFNTVKQMEELLAILSAVIYWVYGARLVGQYRQWLFDSTSNTDYPTYSWLRQIALLFCLLIGLWATAFLLDTFWRIPGRSFIPWQVFFIYLSGLIYYLGFRGYALPDNPAITEQLAQQQKHSFKPFEWIDTHPSELSGPSLKAPLVEVDFAKQEALKGRVLNALTEQKLYLDPELSIQKLADKVGSSASVLSKVINNSFGRSFRTLINEYRVEAVKAMLSSPNAQQYSLVGIGFECGFNSEASFYRIFRTLTGVSPKVYAEQQQTSGKSTKA